MPLVAFEDGRPDKKFETLFNAQKFCKQEWPKCFLDGNVDEGADEIYVYEEEDLVAKITEID